MQLALHPPGAPAKSGLEGALREWGDGPRFHRFGRCWRVAGLGLCVRVLGAVWASLVAVEGYEEDSLFWCDLSSPIW